jgi:hypothetical protein
VTNSRDSETDVRDAFETLVGLARQSPDPAAVDYALLRLQLVLKTQVTGIELALQAMADGPDRIGAACYEDVRAIALRKASCIAAAVDDLPRLASDRTTIDLRAEEHRTPGALTPER